MTNEMHAESGQGALGRLKRLRHAPVKVSEGNAVRPLTNKMMARLFEMEDTVRL